MGLLSGWQEVARVDLARRARDPLGFAIWLGIPLVIAGMLQLAFGGGGGDGDGGGSPKADVLLAVPDEGFLAQMAPFLLSGGGQAPLEVEAVSVEAGRERIALGEADAYVELPADFVENLFKDEPQTVAVLTHPARRVGPALVTGMLEALVEMQRLSQQILGQPLRELVEREADAFANGPNPANVALVGEVFQGVMDRSAPLFFPPALTLERIEPPAEVADEEPAGLSGMVLIFFPSILFLTLFFLAAIAFLGAYHLYGGTLVTMDDAYPRLARDVLPTYLSGFFLAVLLGAVLSSFNSLLNSASTLFAVDLYQPLRPSTSDEGLIRVARIVGTVLALFSFLIAPLLQYAPEGVWQLIRKFTGFYNIPIIAIVVMAVFTSRTSHRVPATGALTAIGFHLVAYTILTFVWNTGVHFIHLYAILFAIEIGIMAVFARYQGLEPIDTRPVRVVDMTPWRHARVVSFILLAAMVGVYVLFSPLGLAR